MDAEHRDRAVALIDAALARLAHTNATISARDAAVRSAFACLEDAEAALIVAQGNLEIIADGCVMQASHRKRQGSGR